MYSLGIYLKHILLYQWSFGPLVVRFRALNRRACIIFIICSTLHIMCLWTWSDLCFKCTLRVFDSA